MRPVHKMASSRWQCLIILLSAFNISSGHFCSGTCYEVWTNGKYQKEIKFQKYVNITLNNEVRAYNWLWANDNLMQWSLHYEEWPLEKMSNGGLSLKEARKTIASLNWKTDQNTVRWSSSYNTIFDLSHISWNSTICENLLTLRFQGISKGWNFYLGEIMIVGGKSGQRKLPKSQISRNRVNMRTIKRINKRQADDDMEKEKKEEEEETKEEEKKKTLWTRLKEYFKEFFNQGENDQRGWMKRIGEWILGFMQRILS